MAKEKLTSPYPKYTSYTDLSSIAQGGTFTVDRTGFYSLYITAQTSGSNSIFQVRTNGYPVVSIVSAGGGAAASLVYLEIGKTYTLHTKLNISNAYLYY